VYGNVSVLLSYANEDLEGVIIVSDGANNITTKSDIINAVQVVTGLGKHKIKVYEMKGE
jgi:stage III sporulation protein AG